MPERIKPFTETVNGFITTYYFSKPGVSENSFKEKSSDIMST